MSTAKAVEIVRLLASESFPTWESASGWDHCELCGKRIPYGKIGEHKAGYKCRACGRLGYHDDLCRSCGEEMIPHMVEDRGVIQDPSLHDEECPWRMAKEWCEETDQP